MAEADGTDGGLKLSVATHYVGDGSSDILTVDWDVETNENTILRSHSVHARLEDKVSLLSATGNVLDKANANNSRHFNAFAGRIRELYPGQIVTVEANAKGLEGGTDERAVHLTVNVQIPG